MRHGAEWWSNLAPKDQPEKGTKMFSLSGQIKWKGVFEVPFGSGTIRSYLENYGGGMLDGCVVKGYQPGGPLSGVLPAAALDLPSQLAPFKERGLFLGGGGIVFFDQHTSVLDLVMWMMGFCEDESCGRCTTCHGGSQRIVEVLRRIAAGGGRDSDVAKLREIAQTMVWSNCAHGQLTPTAIKVLLNTFGDEVDSLIKDKRDPSVSLPGFIEYRIRNQADEALAEAEEICPTQAITHEGTKYDLNDAMCVRCGACKEVAPNAIEVRHRTLGLLPMVEATADAAGG
jgi:NADH:ubiquinone oxidoreductase subunit F (NADH-binding)